MFAKLSFLVVAVLIVSACQPLPSVNAFSAEGRAIYQDNMCAYALATQTRYSHKARSCESRAE
jgi:hypothetical protein